MRMLVALVVVAALAAVAAPARASSVTLWGCHGPAGGALPFSYGLSGTSQTAFSFPGGGCGAAGGSIRVGFGQVLVSEGQAATLTFATPAGVTVERIMVGRSVNGSGYWARTPSTLIEALDAPGTLDGAFDVALSGSSVELGLKCAAPAAPCDTTGTALELRFAADHGPRRRPAADHERQRCLRLRVRHAAPRRRGARHGCRAHRRRGDPGRRSRWPRRGSARSTAPSSPRRT